MKSTLKNQIRILQMNNLVLTVIVLLVIGLTISCYKEEMKLSKDNDNTEPYTENQRAQFPMMDGLILI